MSERAFIPALRFPALTRLYDPLIRAAMKEDRFRERLVQQLAAEPGHRILDVGCGTGTLAILVKRATPDARVTGLDADQGVLDIARRKAARERVEIDFVEGSATAPPFPDGAFDRVVSSLVFHHLTGDDKAVALRRIRGILRRGGELHVADWGKPHGSGMRLAFLAVQALDGFATTSEHVTGRLMDRMRETGFSSVEETHRERTLFGTLAFYRARAE